MNESAAIRRSPAIARDDDVPAIVAGTLCLMSCFAQHPLALYARRINDNLERLGRDVELSPELRSVCRRLAEQWDGIAIHADARATSEGAPRDCRPLH
jgi:hypothetical protein